jgi:tetratricopeptide (TPR) repeat protein
MKPRIFISAVTSELGSTRQLVANVLLRLGYDPVTQDIFGTESGDLRQVLRDKIDDCDGLIQLVGRGYGVEPPTVGAEFAQDGFTRVSYTQFEFLYARSRDKKTWLIFADEGCTLDHPLAELDLPRDPTHPDPAGYQSERRALQEAWRQHWKQEAHLHHGASSDTDVELKVERLRDEFRGLRRSFWRWQQTVTVALVALLLLGGGIWWTVFRQHAEVKRDQQGITQVIQQAAEAQTKIIEAELAKIKPDEIKEQLRKTIEATYQREVQAAEKLTEWQKRDEAKRDAAAARDKRLGQVDEFLTSITSTIKSGDASPEFLELTRIIQEQGVDQALAYITRQESRLLEEAEALTLKKRRTLAPLLEGVRLHRSKGELAEARTLCDKLLKQDADWLDVLHEHYVTMIELGDRATKYETVAVALAHFEAAEVSAKRLVQADAQNPIWQRDLSISFERLGDVFLTLGRTDDALTQFQAKLKIDRALVESDPKHTENQRNLSISLNRLGDVFLTLGRTDDALTQFQDGLQIFRVLAEADPNDAQKQRDLSVSFNKLGDVFLTLGRTDDALTQFQDGLKIRRALAEADPNDAQKQRDLIVSHYKLGLVHRAAKDFVNSVAAFNAALQIARPLQQKGLLAEQIDGLIEVLEAERKKSEQLRDAP